MDLKAHISNIHQVTLGHLQRARTEVVAAVALFTDRELFDQLCSKARNGVKVSVVLLGDTLHRSPYALNFSLLCNLGGDVVFLPSECHSNPIAHQNFCVVDGSTVITGSYNWTHQARNNDDYITVITGDSKFAGKYVDAFKSLIARSKNAIPAALDMNAVKRRLELIRNLVMLGEHDDIAPHLIKLQPVAVALQLSEIITALEKGEFSKALEEMDVYADRFTALVSSEQVDVSELKFVLESAETRLESLADEKAELERRLITFNRRHDDALGDVIQRLLKAKAELARLMATEVSHGNDGVKQEEAEAEAGAAEDAYKDYAREHSDLKRAEPLPKLDDESERELKWLYRKACSLCHPDKFSADKKESAHRAFVELQEAYKSNDLAKLREIYRLLVAGEVPGIRSTTLSNFEALTAAIAEMEFSIIKHVTELKALIESDAFKLLLSAGEAEDAWQRFFEQHEKRLGEEVARVVSRILELQRNE